MDQTWTEKQIAHETRDMEYKALRYTQHDGPKLQETSDNELRDRMIGFRKAETERKSNREIVDAVNKYFEDNNTMPGEKPLKTVAGQFARYFANVQGNDQIMDSCRDKMIEEYSQICIREMHVKGVQNMDTIQHYYGYRATQTEDGKDKLVVSSQLFRKGDTGFSYEVAVVEDTPDGLRTDDIGMIWGHEDGGHHRDMDGMMAETLIIDHTNGKMKNVTVRAFVDLGQDDGGQAPELAQAVRADEEDDFTKAVNELSGGNELSM